MAELSAALIVDQALPTELDLSPDGRLVAYVLAPQSRREEHPVAAVWVAPSDGSGAPRQFTAGVAHDHAPRWSPDGATLAFLSDRAIRGTDALYRIAAAGGEARPLTPTTHRRSIKAFAWSPDGAYVAFTSADEPDAEATRREQERDDADVYGARWPFARLRLLAPAGGEIRTLAAGDRHVDRFAWAPSGAEIAFTTRRTPALASRDEEVRLERVALDGGQPRQVCRVAHAIESLCWTADGQALLFEAPVAQRPQSSLAVYAVPATGSAPRRIALGEDSCSAGLAQPRPPGALSAGPLVGEARGLETRLCRLDPATGQLQPLALVTEEAGPVGMPHWTARAAAGGVLVAAVLTAAGQPGDIWTGRVAADSTGATLTRVTRQHRALSAIRFGAQDPFLYAAPDGQPLDGLLVWPPDATRDRPLPLIVQVHGGPYTRYGHGCYCDWAHWAQWLAQAGYAVLMSASPPRRAARWGWGTFRT
jgi:dipeptidyl aminopeptidase/acylaminoacyl peptidase